MWVHARRRIGPRGRDPARRTARAPARQHVRPDARRVRNRHRGTPARRRRRVRADHRRDDERNLRGRGRRRADDRFRRPGRRYRHRGGRAGTRGARGGRLRGAGRHARRGRSGRRARRSRGCDWSRRYRTSIISCGAAGSPNIAGRAGRALGLAPLFEFRDGAAHAMRPARGSTRRSSAWSRAAGARRGRVRGVQVVVLHAQSPEAAEKLLARVEEELAPATAFVASFGVVMVVHTGTGADRPRVAMGPDRPRPRRRARRVSEPARRPPTWSRRRSRGSRAGRRRDPCRPRRAGAWDRARPRGAARRRARR